jgi:ABC-type enterochelin transport system permease subunit
MKLAAIILTIAGVANVVLIEIVRSLAHSRRAKKDKTAGTQDIAMIGTMITAIFVISAASCWSIWFIRK